ncbi:MAG: hypothetical protein UT33_C0005G0140 [Candidatus Peregrinibacteria bacterium GW2011_GWC2_39_14]|nr:MAG: hypothetical protein US92_C0001G0141 [Candidatus Peregrinibacteria bacterium GW2011_GWA2_38_36]KKR07196.1 MAG: hypothetical protein UT33_C0005G0140 [Candidatus Peregrinibacteria bacterium GW2011_GWC2_39_14]
MTIERELPKHGEAVAVMDGEREVTIGRVVASNGSEVSVFNEAMQMRVGYPVDRLIKSTSGAASWVVEDEFPDLLRELLRATRRRKKPAKIIKV